MTGMMSLYIRFPLKEAAKRLKYQATNHSLMTHDSVEAHLAELAELVDEAEKLGIDLWPETKPVRPWAKYALASFMIIMMLSWVSKVMFRFATV